MVVRTRSNAGRGFTKATWHKHHTMTNSRSDKPPHLPERNNPQELLPADWADTHTDHSHRQPTVAANDHTHVPEVTWEEYEVENAFTDLNPKSPPPHTNRTTNPAYDDTYKKRSHVEITADGDSDDRIQPSAKELMYQRGEHMTEEMSNKQTPLKIEFNLRPNTTKFNLRNELIQLLLQLKIADKTISITTVNHEHTWPDSDDIPTGNILTDLLQARNEYNPNTGTKIIIHFVLSTTQMINTLKFHPVVYRYISEKKIYISHDRFRAAKTRSPGFFTLLPARLIWKQDFQQKLNDVITTIEPNENDPIVQEYYKRHSIALDTPAPAPHFILQKVQRKFGDIQSEVLQVITNEEDGAYVKRMFSYLGENNLLPDGKFIPSGFHLMAGVDSMKCILREHNQYLTQLAVVGIEGLSPESMQTIIPHECDAPRTLRDHILHSVPTVTRIEYTNATTTKGKWFILLSKGHEDTLHNWLQTTLRELFDHVPPDQHVPGYDGPQRAGSNNNTTIVGGYAAVLLNSLQPTHTTSTRYNTHITRPSKRPVINLLDDQDYPALNPTDVPQQRRDVHRIQTPSKETNTIPLITPTALHNAIDQKVDSLKQLLQTQMTTKMDALTAKFETHINTNIDKKLQTFETQINNSIDTKLDNFLLKLQRILPLQTNVSHTTVTPAPTPHIMTDTNVTQQSHQGTVHLQNPGLDPLMTQEIMAVGNEQSTDGDLI